jgi:low temperature requirement protein LtrA
MGAVTATDAEREAVEEVEPDGGEHAVTPLELFFDLVFVFALTQVTALMAAEPTWEGLAKGLLVLAAVWWAWVGFSWLTNVVEPEHAAVRLAMFAAMAAMFVVALAVPHAFNDDALLFAVAYAVVRVMHIALFALAPNGAGFGVAVKLFAPRALTGVALLVVASTLDGAAQGLCWLAALTIDYTAVVGRRQLEGWRVHAEHFAERHGLIFLIAIGESVVAAGIGLGETELDAPAVLAAVLAVAIAAALWWSYFDVVAVVAARVLERNTGVARVAMARDSYSWLHLPMIAGVVLVALGLKKALGDAGEPLKLVPAVALCGGAALYLVAHVAFRWRNVRSVNRQRLLAAAALAALVPLAREVDALGAVAAVAGVLVALVAFEAVRFAEARHRVRAGA